MIQRIEGYVRSQHHLMLRQGDVRDVGFGLALLPILLPQAWDLPYDVVTIPLAEVTKGVDVTFASSGQTIGARSRSGSRSLIVDRTSASDATKF